MSEDSKHPASQPESNTEESKQKKGKTSLLEVTQGVLAALFGVQSARNRERDFKRGDASDYIFIFVIAVVGLVIATIVAVNLIISSAS
jgi:uncharacterized membrane protein YidH (DUF202 family)